MKKTVTKILTASTALTMGLSGLTPLIMPVSSAWAEEPKTDIILNDLETLSPYMKFEYIDPDLALRFVFNRRPLEFTLAYMDYGSGVTEAEADALLPNLGAGGGEGFVTIVYDDRPSLGYTFAPKSPAKLEDNQSEIIYYALHYGTKDATTGEVEGGYWVRGRVDYRRCYHSDAYHEGVFCRPLADSTTGKLTFLPVATKSDAAVLAPAGEEVISWEDEWRQIMRQRSETMLATIRQFDYEFPNVGQKLLEKFEKDVYQLERAARKIPNTNTILSCIAKVLRLLPTVRSEYNASIGQDQYTNYQQLQSDYQDLQDKLSNIDQGTEGLLETITQKEAEIVRLTEVVKTQESEIRQNKSALAEKESRIAGLETQLRTLRQLQIELDQLKQENQILQQKVVELETALAQAEKNSDKNNSTEIQAWQKKVSDLRAELQRVRENLSETEARLQAVQTVKTTLREELEKKTTENTQIKQASAEEFAKLRQENAELAQEREKLLQENQNLNREKQVLQARVQALEAELAQKTTGGVGEIRINDEAQGSLDGDNAIIETETAATATVSVEEPIEVPILGEIKTQTNWWWVAAGAMAFFGALGLWCKRHFSRR